LAATWKTYLYLGSFVILCILGILVQYKMKKNVEEENLEGHAELNESITPNINDVSVSMSLSTNAHQI